MKASEEKENKYLVDLICLNCYAVDTYSITKGIPVKDKKATGKCSYCECIGFLDYDTEEDEEA